MDIRIHDTYWNTAEVSKSDLPAFLSDFSGHVQFSHLNDKDKKKTLTTIYKACCDAEKKPTSNEESAPINTVVSQKEEGKEGGE